MKLYAISDLHVGFKENREALLALPAHPADWLILCGDIGDTPQQLDFALQVLGQKFAKLIWVPGNHELWTVPRATGRRSATRRSASTARAPTPPARRTCSTRWRSRIPAVRGS